MAGLGRACFNSNPKIVSHKPQTAQSAKLEPQALNLKAQTCFLRWGSLIFSFFFPSPEGLLISSEGMFCYHSLRDRYSTRVYYTFLWILRGHFCFGTVNYRRRGSHSDYKSICLEGLGLGAQGRSLCIASSLRGRPS